MEKKSITNHKVFLKKSTGYKAMVDRMLIIERKFIKELAEKSPPTPTDYLEGAKLTLSIASYYIAQNEIYVNIFTTSNEAILKSARKYIAITIDYLAKIYSNSQEFVFDEKDVRHQAHLEIAEFVGYEVATRTGFYLEYLDQFFDPQSRWHWNVLDLSFDLALIFKNTFIFKKILQQLDIRAENVYERKTYVGLLKTHLSDVADGYRLKYEVTRMNSDMDRATQVLEVLKYLHMALNEPKDMEAQSRKIELWKAKAIADHKG
jgi:hypothetical protein